MKQATIDSLMANLPLGGIEYVDLMIDECNVKAVDVPVIYPDGDKKVQTNVSWHFTKGHVDIFINGRKAIPV